MIQGTQILRETEFYPGAGLLTSDNLDVIIDWVQQINAHPLILVLSQCCICRVVDVRVTPCRQLNPACRKSVAATSRVEGSLRTRDTLLMGRRFMLCYERIEDHSSLLWVHVMI